MRNAEKAFPASNVAITRMAQGNPGYRIYFGRDGERLVILLGGGTKKRQQDDVHKAQNLWADYKQRKKEEK